MELLWVGRRDRFVYKGITPPACGFGLPSLSQMVRGVSGYRVIPPKLGFVLATKLRFFVHIVLTGLRGL
jgi:hypothetical protein